MLSETILLIDEADSLLFKKDKSSEELADAVAVVGLSATFGGS